MIWKALLGSLQPAALDSARVFVRCCHGLDTRPEDAKVRADGAVEFGWNWPAVAAWILFLLWLAICCCRFSKARIYRSVNDLLVFFVTLCGFAIVAELPGTIHVRSEGLERSTGFAATSACSGLRSTRSDTGFHRRMVTVTGPGRIRIVHSALTVDRARFLFEIKRYMGSKLPPEFPASRSQRSRPATRYDGSALKRPRSTAFERRETFP